MEICEDGHRKIVYTFGACPVCEVLSDQHAQEKYHKDVVLDLEHTIDELEKELGRCVCSKLAG